MRAAGKFPFSNFADTRIAKIEKALPSDKTKDLCEFLTCLHIGQISPLQDLSDMGEMDQMLLPAFEMSLLQRQHIRFNYKDSKGRDTLRECRNTSNAYTSTPLVSRCMGPTQR